MTKPFPFAVRAIGPGSQPADDTPLDVLDLPRDMPLFAMPRVPDAPRVALAIARDVLAVFRDECERTLANGGVARLDLAGVDDDVLRVLDEMLGEGEVAIHVGPPYRFRIQESVFTGIWRVCALDGDGMLAADWLEAAPVPSVVAAGARAAAHPRIAPVDVPAGAMNSPALIAELSSRVAKRAPGESAHVVNLTLFPMSPDDHAVLEAALPVGPVAIMSRGFGSCRITSTLLRDTWRVQYFNSMSTLILDTLEVVDVPEVALAAAEDLADSAERLAELVDWMGTSIEEAMSAAGPPQGDHGSPSGGSAAAQAASVGVHR